MARNFNGTTGYLYSPSESSAISSSATLSIWLKRDIATPASATQTGFCAFGADESAENSHYPYTDGLGYLALFRNGGARVDAIDLGSTDRSQWHHVAITSQPGANGWQFFVAGQLRRQVTGHSTINFQTGDWWFGRSGSSGQYYFEGAMADVAIWNVALTAGEIGSLANGRAATSLTSRLANVVVYQDLIRPLNRPGLGATFSSAGSTSVVDHHPMRYFPGMQHFAAGGFAWSEPLRAVARQAQRAGAVSGQLTIAGVDAGTTLYAGEVAS